MRDEISEILGGGRVCKVAGRSFTSAKNYVEISQDANVGILNINQVTPEGTTIIVVVASMYENQGRTVMADSHILIRASNNRSRGMNSRLTEDPDV